MTEKRRVRVDAPGGRELSVPHVRNAPTGATESTADEPPPERCACPRLDAHEWHEVESDWSDITFLKTSIGAAMGVPIGYGAARERLEKKAREAGAKIPEDAMALLGEGRVRRPLLLEVEAVPAGARDIERPGGIAYSHLVPASLGQMKRLTEETRAAAIARYGKSPDDTWVWYLTCRVCSAERDYETLIIAHYRKRP